MTGVFCTFGEVKLPLKLQDIFPSCLQLVNVHCICTDIVIVPVIIGDVFTEIQYREVEQFPVNIGTYYQCLNNSLLSPSLLVYQPVPI